MQVSEPDRPTPVVSSRLPYREQHGWTDGHRAFRDWLLDELRSAGCDVRTLSPMGMAQVTVEHMVRTGWIIAPGTPRPDEDESGPSPAQLGDTMTLVPGEWTPLDDNGTEIYVYGDRPVDIALQLGSA